MTKKRITILGSTGSIGTQTIDIVMQFPDQFDVIGLSGHRNIDRLIEQIQMVSPQLVCVSTDSDKDYLHHHLSDRRIQCDIVVGQDGLQTLASANQPDLVVIAIVGTTALAPTAKAIQAGIPIALACKEVLVSGGSYITQLAKTHQVPLLPVDSEHAAIQQCLSYGQSDISTVDRFILTASGGPFWSKPNLDLSTVTPDQALNHPNWTMGGKITIDSATLMNKGLEVIEAHFLFDMPYNQIDVVIHPQSIVHSFVEFKDGIVLAQMGPPDMRYPIQYALTYPDIYPGHWPRLDLMALSALTFEAPDTTRFPLLKLAYDCGRAGGVSPAILTAANEAAVTLFLNHQIAFSDIESLIRSALDTYNTVSVTSLADIVDLDHTVKQSILCDYVS